MKGKTTGEAGGESRQNVSSSSNSIARSCSSRNLATVSNSLSWEVKDEPGVKSGAWGHKVVIKIRSGSAGDEDSLFRVSDGEAMACC